MLIKKKNKVEIIRGEAFLVDEHTLRVVTEEQRSNILIQPCYRSYW